MNAFRRLRLQYFICAFIVSLPFAYACLCFYKGFYYTNLNAEYSTENFILAGLFFFIAIALCVACCYHTSCSKSAARARMDLIIRNFNSAKATAQRRMLGAFQMKDVYSSIEVDVERGESTDNVC